MSFTSNELAARAHVLRAITNGCKERSRLSAEALALHTFSGVQFRHCLNNLCARPDTRYLEVGLFKGGTFISALYGNAARGVGIENFSEFQGLDARPGLHANLALLDPEHYTIIEEDALTLDIGRVAELCPNVYFYDGAHGGEAQTAGITHFEPILAHPCIVVVDDYDWTSVREAHERALKALPRDLVCSCYLRGGDGEHFAKDGWWNGAWIGVLA